MASPRQLLPMIRSAADLDMRVEVYVDSSAGESWINIYEDEAIAIEGTNDDLIFVPQVGQIEYVAGSAQGGPYEVLRIRITETSDTTTTYPETTFTPIEVAPETTLRFTEIKLTLT